MTSDMTPNAGDTLCERYKEWGLSAVFTLGVGADEQERDDRDEPGAPILPERSWADSLAREVAGSIAIKCLKIRHGLEPSWLDLRELATIEVARCTEAYSAEEQEQTALGIARRAADLLGFTPSPEEIAQGEEIAAPSFPKGDRTS